MVRKKQKVIPERRRAKHTPTTSRDGSESAASEEPHGVTDMELPLPATSQASRPGTPENAGSTSTNCKKLQDLANLIEVYSMTIETSQKILQGLIDKGLTDPNNPIIRRESSYLELNNTRLQKAVSEYASLPPCDIPNCTRHNPKNTPVKNNSPDPSPPPTPIPTKRKENTEGFTSPPSRKLTKSTLSNSNPDLNFKLNLNNKFNALENTVPEAPTETAVRPHKSPESTSLTTNQTSHSPKLPPPIMLLITDDLRFHIKTLTGKMPALCIKTAGKYVKLYTDTQPQRDTLKQLLEELKYPFYTFTPKHERPIKVVIKGLPRTTKTAEIHSDLLDLGFTLNKVTQLTGNITKQLLSVFSILLPRNTFNEGIFHLKTLGYLSITVEGFESRGVIQCFQCNQFNHTAEHCHLTPNSLKCGEKHQTRDCQIKRLDTPCINCQVHGHMANYSKCPLFPKPRKGSNIKSNPIISNDFIRPNISYAQATRQTSHSDTTQQMAPPATTPIDTQTPKEIPTPIILPTQSSNTQTDCLSLITQTLHQTIHALSTLVQHISQLTSPQPASIPPTPCHNKNTLKTSITKSEIVKQINVLLNQFDEARD
ncbi:nucleic-acid-binding protein from transposon X-element [Trichonephila clavipes]|nr:nucleic-acid-binding protein from transposon X-element [Trichonephila clavipes]